MPMRRLVAWSATALVFGAFSGWARAECANTVQCIGISANSPAEAERNHHGGVPGGVGTTPPVVPPVVDPVVPAVRTPVIIEPIIEPAVRIVTRQGVLKGSVSIQAPTYYELRALDTGKTINYVHAASTNLVLKKFKGSTIIVTGEEMLDERWPNTPVINVDNLQIVP